MNLRNIQAAEAKKKVDYEKMNTKKIFSDLY